MKNIDDFLKSNLDNYQEEPKEEIWNLIEGKIIPKKNNKDGGRYYIGKIAATLLILIVAAYFVVNHQSPPTDLFHVNDNYKPIITEDLAQTEMNEIYTYEDLKALELAYHRKGNLYKKD